MSFAHFQNWVLGLFLLRELYIKEINLWFELQIFLFYCLSPFTEMQVHGRQGFFWGGVVCLHNCFIPDIYIVFNKYLMIE